MSNTPAINFSGLSSGIDTSGIIKQLVAASQKPVQALQAKESDYNNQLSAYQDFNSQLTALQAATTALNQTSTFNATSGASSNTAVATITATSSAAVADHSLSVTQLAQAQKLISAKQTSGSTALGYAGNFTVNGKTVTIAASDALNDIAVKINAVKAGASATVVNVGPNDYRLTLTSTATGTANALAAADGTGGVLVSLGVLSGATAVRQSITVGSAPGVASLSLSSSTQPVGTAFGFAAGAAPAGTISLTGTDNVAQSLALDLNSDSLSSIANKINGAGITGVTAQVVSLPDSSGTVTSASKQQLQIVGLSDASKLGDGNGVLATLGVLQQGFGNQIVSAQDAKFTIDGLSLTRSANVVSDAVQGATIKLLSGTAATPGIATLSVSQNTDTAVSAVTSLVNAYNSIQDFVANQQTFTPPKSANGKAVSSPPLFSSTTLTNIQSQLSNTLGAVYGNETLESIGITVNTNGTLKLDSSILTTALQNNPSQVAHLFGQAGSSNSSSLQYVNASAKTIASDNNGYAVTITQAATQSSGTASIAQSSPSLAAETLTFGGTIFPSPISITLPKGSSLSDTVTRINSDSALNGSIYAAIDPTGKLTLSSQSYGTGTGFTVTSDQTATDGTNTGIGAETPITAGVPVAGTINGEPATGSGRTLTGNSGNAHTEALTVLVSSHTIGPVGHVTLTHGVADALSAALSQILDPTNGTIISAENSLNSQISDTNTQITSVQSKISDYQSYLQSTFSQMETRISQLKAQGDAFAAEAAKL